MSYDVQTNRIHLNRVCNFYKLFLNPHALPINHFAFIDNIYTICIFSVADMKDLMEVFLGFEQNKNIHEHIKSTYTKSNAIQFSSHLIKFQT